MFEKWKYDQGREILLPDEAGLTQESWVDCKENRQCMAAKGPPFGRVDIFQTSPTRWAEIAAHLKTGREIEFICGGKQYSITNARGFWNFYGDTDGAPFIRICASRELDLLAERAAGIAIGDRSLREIFDKQLYDGESLCIL